MAGYCGRTFDCVRTKDEGRGTKDEGRRTKDEGRRTRDEGRGTNTPESSGNHEITNTESISSIIRAVSVNATIIF